MFYNNMGFIVDNKRKSPRNKHGFFLQISITKKRFTSNLATCTANDNHTKIYTEFKQIEHPVRSIWLRPPLNRIVQKIHLSTAMYATSGNSRLSNTHHYSTALNQCVTPHPRLRRTACKPAIVSPKLNDALSRPTSRLVSTPPPYASFEHAQDRPTLIDLGHKHRVLTSANT